MKPIIAASTLACLALASSMPIRAQSAAPLPNFTHIYVIAMENREFTDVIGNASAPYVNSLAQRYALKVVDHLREEIRAGTPVVGSVG